MKVLVTGGAGFIGRWVVQQLLADRRDVWVVDNFSSGRLGHLAEFRRDRRLRDVLRLDLRQRRRLEAAVRRIRPQVCLHLAAQVNVQTSLQRPRETFEINVAGTHHLLEALRPWRPRLLVAGTCLVYRPTPGALLGETAPVEPRSPYAGSKLAADDLALGYARGYRWPIVVARPFNTYGPFQRADAEGGVIAIFIQRQLAKQPLLVFGDGRQTRDFLYVEDCAAFLVRAALHPRAAGEIFNAGTGCETAIRELARRLADGVPIRLVPHHHPQAEIPRLACDARKARRLLGWRPTVSLTVGLPRTLAWHVAHCS